MEFLLISENKLKIVLTDEDLRRHSLEAFVKERSEREGRRNFWQILDRAKSEVGFDAGGDKLLIQFYPLKSGCCEVFVTKLGILSTPSAKLVTRSDRVTILSRERGFYSFSTYEDLSRALIAVKASLGSEGVICDLYRYRGHYILSLMEYAKGGDSQEFYSIIEFGSRMSKEHALFISEHADRIFTDSPIEKILAFREGDSE